MGCSKKQKRFDCVSVYQVRRGCVKLLFNDATLMVCCITGHPGSGGVQREVPEASEDMGRPAASLLVPFLPLHVCTCVLLVHASAAGQASRLVSRLPSISTSVSVRGLAPILPQCNHNTSLTLLRFSLPEFGFFEKCSL